MTHPTLKDAARAVIAEDHDAILDEVEPTSLEWGERLARAVLLSIRPPDREDLPLRQLEARDYIDGVLKG